MPRPKTIKIGSKVKVKRGSEKENYVVVYPYEARVENGKISCNCPLGKALLGRSGGDEVEIRISPHESVKYLIEEVE